jgi:hypothetical protein
MQAAHVKELEALIEQGRADLSRLSRLNGQLRARQAALVRWLVPSSMHRVPGTVLLQHSSITGRASGDVCPQQAVVTVTASPHSIT